MTTVCHRPEGLDQLEAQSNFTKQELQILYRGFKNVIYILIASYIAVGAYGRELDWVYPNPKTHLEAILLIMAVRSDSVRKQMNHIHCLKGSVRVSANVYQGQSVFDISSNSNVRWQIQNNEKKKLNIKLNETWLFSFVKNVFLLNVCDSTGMPEWCGQRGNLQTHLRSVLPPRR